MGVQGYGSASASDTVTLHLAITSDIHGWLSTSIVYPERKRKGLLHISPFLRQQRIKHPDLILLDAGDLLEGSPLSFYNHQFSRNSSDDEFLSFVNGLNYDAVTVGNHDLGLNPLFETRYVKRSRFAWLGANISRRGKPAFKPYVILIRNQVKIAIIGFTTPGVLMWMGPNQLQSLEIESLKESARRWIKTINRTEKPDIIIGSFHAGINPFRDTEESKIKQIPPANDLRETLKAVPGFHLAVSGHDHRLNPSRSGGKVRYIENVPVISGGCHGEAIVFADLTVARKNGSWHTQQVNVMVKKASQRKEITDQYSSLIKRDYREYLNKEVPWLFTQTSPQNATICLNTLNALAQDEPGIDGTLFPHIKIRSVNSVANRRIKRSDLFKWLRYHNKPVGVKLSSRDLNLLNRHHQKSVEKPNLAGRSLFPWFKQLEEYEPETTWLLNRSQYDKKYVIKISDYHFWGGGGVFSRLYLKDESLVKMSDVYLKDRLFDYLSAFRELPEVCSFLYYQP